jgi:hypothetical protein
LVGSYLNPPPIPPVLSSNPPDFPLKTCVSSKPPPFKTPELGKLGQGVRNLWERCTKSTKDTSTNCTEIRTVFNFFNKNYVSKCSIQPSSLAMIQAVYGWVPIHYSGCAGGKLVSTPGYTKTIATYCTCQYNYLVKTLPAADIFNPYTALIHRTLQSSAYAFSIDDELSFKRFKDKGIIITIGGGDGLVNKTPVPLPNLKTYKKQCRSASS